MTIGSKRIAFIGGAFRKSSLVGLWLLGSLVLSAGLEASAQTYPNRTIRMIVAYPAGGPNDIVGRAIAQKLNAQFGQPVVVENRGGAGGTIGTGSVAKATPDGYTLLMGAGAMTIAPSIYPKLPYDVTKDLAPISLAAMSSFVLVLHPAVPARNVEELIDLARRKPGMLSFASSGLGAPPHLAAELFKTRTNTKMTHVPYKGATPALIDLMGGHVDLYFGGISGAVPHIESGKLRALAVTSKSRSRVLPNLATLDESGVKGFDISTWWGLLAPAGTPADIIKVLHAATVKAVEAPDVQQRLLAVGAEPRSSTPQQFEQHMKDEIQNFAQIVKTSGAKFE